MTYGVDNYTTLWVRKNNGDVEHYDGSQDTYYSLNNTVTGVSQSFTSSNLGYLTGIKTYLLKVGTPTGNIVAKLYTETHGTGSYGTTSIPGTLLATSDNVDVSTISNSAYQLVNFTFSSTARYYMQPSTYYCLSIEYTGTAGSYVRVSLDNTATAATGNSAYYSSGTWAGHYDSTKDVNFYVLATQEQDITTSHYTHEIVEKKNLLSTFQMTLLDLTDDQRENWVLENSEILTFWGTVLRFKGRIERITYDNYAKCTIEGVGMACYLRDRMIDARYDNKNTDYIVQRIASVNSDGAAPWIMNIGTNTNYGLTSVYYASDNKLHGLQNLVKDINYEWWESYGATPYLDNYISVNTFRDPTETPPTDPATGLAFTFASDGTYQNMSVVDQLVDSYETCNYVVATGMGDGVNQLKSIAYAATVGEALTNVTTLAYPLDARLQTALNATDVTSTVYVYNGSGLANGNTIRIDNEVLTLTSAPTDSGLGYWTFSATRGSSSTVKAVHAIGADVIHLTGNIMCVSATFLPTSGYVYVGNEKIQYTTKSGNNLPITIRGVVPYLNDRIVKPYYHSAGAEVFDATYSEQVPQTGSWIQVDGIRSRQFSDTSIIDQDLLDHVAVNIRNDRQNHVNMITVQTADPTNVLTTIDLLSGSWVYIADTYTGFVTGTPYEIVGMTYGFDPESQGEYCKCEISNYNPFLLQATAKDTDNLGKYYKGATNVYQVGDSDNCDSTHGLTLPFYIPADAAAINKVLVSYNVSAFRGYGYDDFGLTDHSFIGGSIDQSYDEGTTSIGTSYSTLLSDTIADDEDILCHAIFKNNGNSGTLQVRFSAGGTSEVYNVYMTNGQIASVTGLARAGGTTASIAAHYISGTHSTDWWCQITPIAKHDHRLTTSASDLVISELASEATGIDIEIDDGNGYVALGSYSAVSAQDIDITTNVGRQTGWKGVRLTPTGVNGRCRIRGDVFIQTFIQSKT